VEESLLKKVTIVGCGPGSKDFLTFAAVKAIDKAELLAGPPRLLDMFPCLVCRKLIFKGNYLEALEVIDECRADQEVVVLVTGDPGVHSLARLVIDRLGRSSCRVVPGVSAVQYAFSLLKIPWQDAAIFSCHGRDLDGLDFIVSQNSKVAVLTGGEEDPARIGLALSERSASGKCFYLCQNLSLENERVDRLTIEELREVRASPLNMIVIVGKDGP
jgi:precorrin-6y C5,15-methyltransferase (decarboxylating) CbiE subunit